MATLSSHTLNGTDGTHAAGVLVSLYCIKNGQSTPLFSSATDAGGRLNRDIQPEDVDTEAEYELVFETGAYWETRKVPQKGMQIMPQIRLRFSMPDPGGNYHMPVILSPNSYSVWWSS